MVFKPIHLARSVISKTFPNGYAQSLVAASQSSSASHSTNFSSFGNNLAAYFGKQPPGSNPSFAANNGLQAPPLATGKGDVGAVNAASSSTDNGLDAYYAAWQKHHRPEEVERHQFQFAKRIGWKAPTTIPDSHLPVAGADVEPVPVPAAQTDLPSDRPAIHRAKSASDLDELKAHEQSVLPQESVASPSVTPTSGSASPQSTRATTVSELDSYVDHLAFLAENQRLAEIPAVFEALLRAGLTPTSTAYNALLLAAIHLPRGKHHVVPKVLDVYADMLRRRVTPDTATYAVIVEVLAARAMDVTAMKRDLDAKRARFGGSGFPLPSDETEFKILAEDDSLRLAIRLFDTSAAVTTNHAFPAETYRLLISACAEAGRINDMVRIYAEMESQAVIPPTPIFAPMITAFAATGDLRSAVECYEEYKALAISHNQGTQNIERRDGQVYAAVVKAYALCGQLEGGLKFMAKIESSLQGDALAAARDAVAVAALVPSWAAATDYEQALSLAEQLSPAARATTIEAIAIDAADSGHLNVAASAFEQVASQDAALALLAAHLRIGDLSSARKMWQNVRAGASSALVEPAAMYVSALIREGEAAAGLLEARKVFARVRASADADAAERVHEAVGILGKDLIAAGPVADAAASLEMVQLMVENGAVSAALAEHLVAALGPSELEAVSTPALLALVHVQAGLMVRPAPDLFAAHSARLAHLLDLVAARGASLEAGSAKLIEAALAKAQDASLLAKWQALQAPAPYPPAPAYNDHFDPYASSTDVKGSAAIVEELEKTHGRHAAHLNEALAKFRNIRRAGRHPRYATYAKLIAAAAKENRLGVAHDVLNMARQDVPLIAQSRVVVHGWVAILDAMVGACLTAGNRDAAAGFHRELNDMGAAPSANTFGLYITTLKESTKTFDEATEAVKVFHRARTEGVEPTSFLYNALIGKLGKARRIDDCLFYFAEMRNLGIRPTSVTYGTVVNALCRVSDDKFAEELFEEMESMPNYKARPAPYNSLMQYFLTTKRDRTKVLAYYDRLRALGIQPTTHTYKLLIDTHATLEPVDMGAAEGVLAEMEAAGLKPDAVHHAALIHAKGCVQHDAAAARAAFDRVLAGGAVAPQASLYQALFESLVANHDVAATEPLLTQMAAQGVGLTPYIANTLIHGWALAGNVQKARAVYDALGAARREPSTYEAMARAYLAAGPLEHGAAMGVVGEALRRGYPAAVANKICDLVGGQPPQ